MNFDLTWGSLLALATEASTRAYAPYSNFAVGAALRFNGAQSDQEVAGANVENCSYGLTLCAERSAVVAAVVRGLRPGGLRRVAVVTHAAQLTAPCGACRQVLLEFAAPDAQVLLANLRQGAERIVTVRELLPAAFGPADLAP